MPDVIVPVTRAAQETLFYCGPATAEMVLSGVNVPSPATPPSWQTQLYNYIVQHTGATRPQNAPNDPTAPPFPSQKCEWCSGEWKCWSTTPGVLVSLLNSAQAAGQYAISKHSDEEPATGVLLDTIDQNLPAVALVYGWLHWLVVDGYRHSERNSVLVAGRKLNGVYIRNPEESKTVHYVRWVTWQSNYLWFIPCGAYKNKIVVLRGMPVKAPVQPTNITVQPLAGGPPPVAQDPWTLPMKRIISPDEAIRKAAEEMVELRSSRFSVALRSSEPGTAQLVQRLDDPDLYYYIVTAYASSRATTRVLVDAFDGEVLEAEGIEQEDERLAPYLPAPEAVRRVAADAERYPDALRYRVRTETIGEHPVLVWKPCAQSRSPFLPFYQLSVGESFIYVRVDGKQFDALTTTPA